MKRTGKLGLTFVLGLAVALVGSTVLRPYLGSRQVSAAVVAALVVAAYASGIRWIERSEIPELAHRGGGVRMIGGMLIGLHAGWNFAEGSLFSMTVSGGTQSRGLLGGALRGPTILTGGAFGPEASVVAVVVCLAAGVFFLWRAVHLGRIEPPAWRRDHASVTHRAAQ